MCASHIFDVKTNHVIKYGICFLHNFAMKEILSVYIINLKKCIQDFLNG